jgi:hypothetical protein
MYEVQLSLNQNEYILKEPNIRRAKVTANRKWDNANEGQKTENGIRTVNRVEIKSQLMGNV